MTSRFRHFLPSTPPYIHPPSPQKDKNNPTCELQFDVRLPAAIGVGRRQPGSLATGCRYLRLVQTKSRGGLDFPWGRGSSRMGRSSLSILKEQAVPKVVIVFIPPSCCRLFYRTEGLAAYLHECLNADVQLAWVGWKASTEAERVTPKEKCLCCQSIL